LTAFARYDSPYGRLTLVGDERGLQAVLWADDPVPAGAEERAEPMLAETARQLDEYFAGNRQRFELPLALSGTPFQLAAWRALADVPYGSTVSYAEQARRVGVPRAVRAIGAANARNPLPIVLPCHRLIGSNGSLVGYGGGLELKRRLLEHEQGARPNAGRPAARATAGSSSGSAA
jgi:methylated-DNA-[protein]-cysteine S-methyltransferase